MDLGSTIIGAILLVICIVPFVIMHYNRKKKENKMLQTLNENAQQYKCKISKYEFCGDFVFGIDESRNFIFFFKQEKEKAISQFVDLTEIKACQVVKKTTNVKNDIGNLSVIDRVELSFIPKTKSKGDTRFELYNEEINVQLRGELQFVDKWSKQINNHLKNKK